MPIPPHLAERRAGARGGGSITHSRCAGAPGKRRPRLPPRPAERANLLRASVDASPACLFAPSSRRAAAGAASVRGVLARRERPGRRRLVDRPQPRSPSRFLGTARATARLAARFEPSVDPSAARWASGSAGSARSPPVLRWAISSSSAWILDCAAASAVCRALGPPVSTTRARRRPICHSKRSTSARACSSIRHSPSFPAKPSGAGAASAIAPSPFAARRAASRSRTRARDARGCCQTALVRSGELDVVAVAGSAASRSSSVRPGPAAARCSFGPRSYRECFASRAAASEHDRLSEALGQPEEDQAVAQVALGLFEHPIGDPSAAREGREHSGLQVVVDVAALPHVFKRRICGQRGERVLTGTVTPTLLANQEVVRKDAVHWITQEGEAVHLAAFLDVLTEVVADSKRAVTSQDFAVARSVGFLFRGPLPLRSRSIRPESKPPPPLNTLFRALVRSPGSFMTRNSAPWFRRSSERG